MKNQAFPFFYKGLRVVFCGIISLYALPVATQTVVSVAGNTGGIVDIKTTLDPTDPIEPSNSPDFETSVGFFYRLEKTDSPVQSYFWPATIHNGVTNADEHITESLKLPNGTYTIIAYQSRKSKPIKTTRLVDGGGSTFNVVGSTQTFPEIVLGASELKLFPSWNIHTHEYDDNTYNPNPEHYTIASEKIPDESDPWVFLTVVKNSWKQGDIKITFPEFLTFKGVVFENCMWSPGAIPSCKSSASLLNTVSVSPVVAGQLQYLTLEKANIAPLRNQEVIHLLFTKNSKFVFPEIESNVGPAAFQVEHFNPDSIELDTTFVFTPKPKPHDPNELAVNKKELCECGVGEELTYRINYQNDGAAPTSQVTVMLKGTQYLDLSTIQHNNDTDDWSAPIQHNPIVPGEFKMAYAKGLPGLKQNSSQYPKVPVEASQDHFYFKVKKADCLPAGTVIQPVAEIQFLGANETITTNLDETKIVKKMDCKPCPPNRGCPNCPKKKPCWLFAWLQQKKKPES